MYNKARNEITFPHLLGNNVLDGKVHNFNCINGGMKGIGQFGLITETFFGGRCIELGLIKEYGFYACKDRFKMDVIGFYIDDPNMVTDLGRKLIKERLAGYDVYFVRTEERPADPIDFAKREELRKEAAKVGYSPEIINRSNAEELISLLKVHEFKEANPDAVANPLAVEMRTPVTEGATEVVITKLPSRGRARA